MQPFWICTGGDISLTFLVSRYSIVYHKRHSTAFREGEGIHSLPRHGAAAVTRTHNPHIRNNYPVVTAHISFARPLHDMSRIYIHVIDVIHFTLGSVNDPIHSVPPDDQLKPGRFVNSKCILGLIRSLLFYRGIKSPSSTTVYVQKYVARSIHRIVITFQVDNETNVTRVVRPWRYGSRCDVPYSVGDLSIMHVTLQFTQIKHVVKIDSQIYPYTDN